MFNVKSTKRALLMSVLALMLCVSMLVGTTYAWFTDSVTSTGNKIVAGNLAIDLKLLEEDGSWTSIKDSSKAIFNYDKWEPGYTDVKVLKVANEGTLALKWVAKFVAAGELSILADVIDVYVKADVTAYPTDRTEIDSWEKIGTVREFVNSIETVWTGSLTAKDTEGDTKNLGIALKMRETADNTYQGLELGAFDIQIFATQFTYEEDSFNDQYDAGAYLPIVKTAEELASAIAQGESVKLGADITLDGETAISSNLNLGGHTLTANLLVADDATVVISNGKLENEDAGYSAVESAGTLVLNDVEVASTRHAVRIAGGTATINGGTYKTAVYAGRTQYALNVSDGAFVTVNGGTFVGPKGTAADSGAAVNVQAGSTVIINGGDFSKGKNDTLSSKGTLTVYGGTFDQNPSAYLAKNFEAEEENGVWTVTSAINDDTALDNAIKEGDTTIYLDNGVYIIPDSAQGKTLTIIGAGDTVIATQDDGSYEGCDYSLDGATVTFENITINTDSTTYTGYARLNATYKNCTINGTYTLYGDSEFIDCTFNVSGDVYNIWTWGAPTATFTGCTFNSDGKAMLLYGTVNTKLTLNNCVFNDNGGLTDLKAAVEIGNDYGKSYELIVNNTVVNGYEINDKGINTGSTLWGNKNSMSTDNLNVVVDGVDVY